MAVLGAGLGTSAVRAQNQPLGASTLRPISESGPREPGPVGLSSRSRALLGGAIGVGAGVPLGVLLIEAAGDESSDFGDDGERARLGVGLLGAFLVVGGGPIGAVQALGGGEPTTYAGAAGGELMFGGAGLALGSFLGRRTESRRAWSLALGLPLAAVGAAGGALLEGGRSGRSRSAAVVRSREGTWRVGVPGVYVVPTIRGTGSVSAHATILRIRF